MGDTLSNKDAELLDYIEQEYLTNGAVPSEDKWIEVGGSARQYRSAFRNSLFRDSLNARGISLRGLDAPATGRLTEHQLVVANTMLDQIGDTRSDKKKLADLGVPSQVYQAWLRDPAYQAYIRSRAESLLGDVQHEAHLALIGRVRSGDVSAIKYYNEVTGRYNPNLNDKADVNSVIMMIVEVIQRHVKDPNVLEKLADDITLIAGGVNAAQPNGVQQITSGVRPPIPSALQTQTIIEGTPRELTL